jgi:hypothetical protein
VRWVRSIRAVCSLSAVSDKIDAVNQSAGPTAYTLLEADGHALIGVLVVLAGHVMGGERDPRLVADLGRSLYEDGAIADPASTDEVLAAISDLCTQVRFVVGQDEGERPERGLARSEVDLAAPPKGVSGVVTVWEVPMGEGPTASCALGKVVEYPSGVELELNLAWAPTPEELTTRVPPRAHGSMARSFQDELIADWRIRVNLPDGRTATTVLSGDHSEETMLENDWEQNDLRLYTQSVETRSRLGTMTARWFCWVPLKGASSIRLTTAWPSGSIPETSVDIDLTPKA